MSPTRLSFRALCDTFRNKVSLRHIPCPPSLTSQSLATTPWATFCWQLHSTCDPHCACVARFSNRHLFILYLSIHLFIIFLASVFCIFFRFLAWCHCRCCGAFSIAFFVILIRQLPYLCKTIVLHPLPARRPLALARNVGCLLLQLQVFVYFNASGGGENVFCIFYKEISFCQAFKITFK